MRKYLFPSSSHEREKNKEKQNETQIILHPHQFIAYTNLWDWRH
jgi:CDP-glycerol glycerophosphotransferase (TagB/SpsB family)